jgi:CheY-like chemotaxis protein
MDNNNYLVNNDVSGIDCNRTYDKDNDNANTVQLFVDDSTVDEDKKEQNDTSSILARILVVDDEPDVNLQLKMVLERVDGFKVDSFIDPESALQYFKSGLYDLAILDIKMPKIDGFELCRKIRKIDNNVRVCFLSASEMYHERFRRKQLYTSDLDCFFLQKPISNEVLRKEVDKILS